ncbi:hypothetical protein ENHY17A_50343 [Moraxellaceae bacterium 17A]|nr:hypothetical protein ENHY17A_50343 [Moraxellaceae bacterium 17A]
MTQLSNVPMQPNPSAVERPLTLIEKLEQARDNHNYYLKTCGNDRDKAYHSFGKKCYQKAIDIVKQHNEWVSVNERLPDIGQRVLTQKGGYMTICSLYRRGQGKMRWNDGRRLSDLEHYTHWMPIPQPPSKAQDD